MQLNHWNTAPSRQITASKRLWLGLSSLSTHTVFLMWLWARSDGGSEAATPSAASFGTLGHLVPGDVRAEVRMEIVQVRYVLRYVLYIYKEVFRCLLQLALIILKWWGCAWVSWWRMEEDDDAYWLKVRCHRHHCLILLGVVYKHFMNRLHLMHTLLSIQTGICQCMHAACMHLPYQRNDHRHHKQEQTSEIIWSPCHVHEGFGNHWCLRIHSYLWLFVLQFVGLKLAVYNSK